jgi:hypothetical protein
MVGSVDYTRSMPFWEQHKWNGSFPVKWHVIKDLPNSQLRHIILENNECKPVTNSRDGQEVSIYVPNSELSEFCFAIVLEQDARNLLAIEQDSNV